MILNLLLKLSALCRIVHRVRQAITATCLHANPHRGCRFLLSSLLKQHSNALCSVLRLRGVAHTQTVDRQVIFAADLSVQRAGHGRRGERTTVDRVMAGAQCALPNVMAKTRKGGPHQLHN